MVLVIEFAGFALLAAAALLWCLLAGLAVSGAELLLIAYLVDYTGANPRLPRPRWPRRRKPGAS